MTMDYVLIVGAPAVGKATVAREVARLTGYRLVLNTLTSEMLLNVFERPEPPFSLLHVEFQHRIVEESARAGISLVSTVAWAYNSEFDCREMRKRLGFVAANGGRTLFAELSAPIDVRLERNRAESRHVLKPNQARTLTDDIMLGMERHRFVSEPGELDEFGPVVRLDTTTVAPGDAAMRIVEAFGLVH